MNCRSEEPDCVNIEVYFFYKKETAVRSHTVDSFCYLVHTVQYTVCTNIGWTIDLGG